MQKNLLTITSLLGLLLSASCANLSNQHLNNSTVHKSNLRFNKLQVGAIDDLYGSTESN